MKNQNLRTRTARGFTLVELLVVIGIIVVLIGILLPVASRAQESARRVKCAGNLRQMGQAILAYATSNDGKFPRIYFDKTDTTPLVSSDTTFFGIGRNAVNPFIKGGPNDGIGSAPQGSQTLTGFNNVPGSIFLLLRASLLTPEVLLCPSAVSAGVATPDKYDTDDSPRKRSNFTELSGLGGPTNLSYSIQVMYPRSTAIQAGWTWDTQFAPESVLAADMNPGPNPSPADTSGSRDPTPLDLTKVANYAAPDAEALGAFNSRHHRTIRGVKEGQNVLYGDFHVEFQTTPECGEYWTPPTISNKLRDNIYTALVVDGTGTPTGPQVLDSGSQNMRQGTRFDTVLMPTANK
jgi:prepilin-type N-terminal cleavage/methylation domain-containing protein